MPADPDDYNQAISLAVTHIQSILKATYGRTVASSIITGLVKDAFNAGKAIGDPGVQNRIATSYASSQGWATAGGTGGSSSGGSGSSGSSGGVSGGGSSFDKGAAKAVFIEALREWGLSPRDGNMGNLVNRAVNAQWSIYEFKQAVRKTKTYAQAFKGIDWRHGMTEGEYIRLFKQYQNLYKDFGFKTGKLFTNKMFGKIIKNGVTVEEFKAKIDALDRMEKNADLLASFKEELIQRGLAGKDNKVSKKELVRFTLGKGDKKWEAVWEMASVTSGLQVAGIELERSEIRDIINQIEGGGLGEAEDLTQAEWKQLASVVSSIPESQLSAFGVSKSDAILAQLGLGKKSGEISQILANLEASRDPNRRAQSQLFETEPGRTVLAGAAPRSSTSI